MWRRKRLNLLNILYYSVQPCVASSNNNKLGTKSHLSTEIVLKNLKLAKMMLAIKINNVYLQVSIDHMFWLKF